MESAKQVFDMAKTAGYHFNLLDIGGGFPGRASTLPFFEEVKIAELNSIRFQVKVSPIYPLFKFIIFTFSIQQ